MSIGSVGRYAGEAGGSSQNFGQQTSKHHATPKAKVARHHLAKARKAKKVTARKSTHHRTSRRRSTHK